MSLFRKLSQNRPLTAAISFTGLVVVLGLIAQLGWLATDKWPLAVRAGLAGLPVLVAAGWLIATRRQSLVIRNLAFSLAWVLVFLAGLLLTLDSKFAESRDTLLTYGLGITFFVGLGWMVWATEIASQHYERRREEEGDPDGRIENPLDPGAWYYGRHNPRLNQSMTMLAAYCVFCCLLVIIQSWLPRGSEIYELPAGGGGGGSGGGTAEQASVVVPQIRVKKVTRKRFVINPLSSIVFAAPPIDDIKLQLPEVTQHLYSAGSGKGGAGSGSGSGIGFGDGDGSGFGSGTGRGKIRFIRLEYTGGDWAQDFGVGADDNMLREYGLRTAQKVAEHTESRTATGLLQFKLHASPPLTYITGQQSISLAKNEAQALRTYLIERHGMLFADNGGSAHWHNQFFAMMRQVVPEVDPVRVPLDDIIHKVPFPVPFLPYVAPHGGKDAWGWKVEGRWVAYYHPGDIGDAWSDGHSGVPRPVWEACYNLGANVIFYAHAEYHKWLASQNIKQ
jgi:hypothetical protein